MVDQGVVLETPSSKKIAMWWFIERLSTVEDQLEPPGVPTDQSRDSANISGRAGYVSYHLRHWLADTFRTASSIMLEDELS
jgi:hypothetical protein